jgi:hypothetical protein
MQNRYWHFLLAFVILLVRQSTGFSAPPSKLTAKIEVFAERSDNVRKNMPNEPYVDPITGRVTLDVSDLKLDMADLGKPGWAEPERVHPTPGEPGKSAVGYVLPNGNIDWDQMARDLKEEDE